MMFITTGSFSGFDALMKKIDELIEKGVIKEKVISQIASGDYTPKHFKWFRFKRTLLPYYKKADLVISHEGAGTLFELVTLHKKAIVLTNPGTVDNPDLVKKFSDMKHLLWCKDVKHLEEFIKKSRSFKPKKYKSPGCHIHEEIIRALS